MTQNNKTRSRGWCFTLNNYEDTDCQVLQGGGKTPEVVSYLIFGKELGESGTPHLQGYLYFKTLKSLKQAKAAISERAHLEPQRGSVEQAVEYCKKDGCHYEYGDLPRQGKRTDLEQVAHMIVEGASVADVAVAHPSTFIKFSRGIRDLKLTVTKSYTRESVCGLWLVGPPGCGKSHYAQTNFPDSYKKAQNKWFDGYGGEKTIVLEDLDIGSLSHHLKIWSDRWPCTGETKGGTVHLMHDLFVVTSNYTIEELVPEKGKDQPDNAMIAALQRRFVVRTFSKRFVPPDVSKAGPGKWISVMKDEEGIEHDMGEIPSN